MKFNRHLASHLTPEWRKHYIHYQDLKKRIYEMIGKPEPVEDKEGEGEDITQPMSPVNSDLQEAFFVEIHRQINEVQSFFRAREAELSHTLHQLKQQVDIFEALHANKRTRDLRATRRKRQNLKLLLSEFYLNLALLQNFQQLNHTGFRKILKKHDKLARSDRGKHIFKENVCKNYFWVSQEVSKLIEETETIMIDKMEDGNRSKAMNRLRVPPLESKDVRSHWATLRAGWLMGVIFVSFFVLILGIIFRPSDSWDHVTPSVRGLRVGLILTVWFYGFAINTFEWRRSGVNNVLIFEFDPRNYLNFVQLFEVASFIGVIFLFGVYLTVFSYWLRFPEWVGPVVMLGTILILFVLPLPVLYHRSRLWLGKELVRILLAPFFYVNFADFWIADQMNSVGIIFLDIEYFWCYMFYGLHFPDNDIQCGSVKYGIRVFLAALPAWFRFAQCLRRYYDTRKAFPHLVNAGKYSTTFFVVFFGSISVGTRVGGVDVQTAGYYIVFVLWIASGIISSCYTFTWDVKMDWGLFEGKFKLRSELIYSSKIYYILAVIEDLIFRSLWTLNISVGDRGPSVLDGNILGTVLALLELFRRFVWNFFRLENEHLNNAGQFRVVRDISIQPMDLSQLPVGEEDNVEGNQLEVPQTRARRISSALVELSTVGSKLSLRQRKHTERNSSQTRPKPDITAIHDGCEEHSNPLSGEHTSGTQLVGLHSQAHRNDSTLPIIQLEDTDVDNQGVVFFECVDRSQESEVKVQRIGLATETSV